MRPETEEEYISLLNQLKEMGIFLMDIVDEPTRIRKGYSMTQLRISARTMIGKIENFFESN